jgi:hypothetical protein
VTKKDIKIWENLRKKFSKIRHNEAIYHILKKMGYCKLADLVKKHDFYQIDNLKTWEEKILFYADKRVEHDKIVTLKFRFKEGRKRNVKPTDDLNLIASFEKKTLKLEKELIKITGPMTLN